MKTIDKGFIIPSTVFTIKKNQIRYYDYSNKVPEIGDLVYGRVNRIGEHFTLENCQGRIHSIHNGTNAIFVFGNRYAADYYEGFVPKEMMIEVDMLSRSGLVGVVNTKKEAIKDPTRISILGYACDKDGKILNTRDFVSFKSKQKIKKFPRSRMILSCGTSMNSGKSMAAVSCCWALKSTGHNVRASKITGTASLKDILHMNDAGANPYCDFTTLGYPSTYMLSQEEILNIFNTVDLKYGNNPDNYWVVEFADGITQRETEMLLSSPDVQSRIHKFIFCSNDAFGAIGGLHVLKEKYGLIPDALSGVCSSTPLLVRELSEFTDIPIFNSIATDPNELSKILLEPKRELALVGT